MEIAIIILILIGVVFWFIIYKDKEKKLAELDKVFKPIEDLKMKIRDISYIKDSFDNKFEPIETTSKYLELNQIRYIFRYSHEKDNFWIEFYLKDKSEENKNYSINRVELRVNGKIIESDLTLLIEKVPKHFAPPYGNRYFSTKSYFGYSLGENSKKEFLFNSRFKFNLTSENTFAKNDSIYIYIDIQEYKNGKFEKLDEIIFINYFNNLEFNCVQEIDEIIKWNE